jgi:hypothetical protein
VKNEYDITTKNVGESQIARVDARSSQFLGETLIQIKLNDLTIENSQKLVFVENKTYL